MNIFIFSNCLLKNAELHPDALVNKGRLEALQMLASVAHRYEFEPPLNDKGNPYGKGYYNHPCTVWAGDTRKNYLFLCDYCQGLIWEAEKRGYAKKYQDKLDHCYSKANLVPDGDLTDIPLAMARTNPFKSSSRDPDFWYRCFYRDNLITKSEYLNAIKTRHAPLETATKFYRGYLMYSKCHYAAWRHSKIPDFWPSRENSGKLFCTLKKK